MPAVRNGSRLFAEWHIVILIAADLTRFLALAFGTTESGLAHITPSMDEASRTLGKSTSQTLYSVHVPLLRGSLLTALLLVFVDVCLLYTSPSPRDLSTSRMPSSA